jgi:serine/threonine protein kinase/DNA-binding transcriptional MerR regulator
MAFRCGDGMDYTLQEAATLLNVPPQTLGKWSVAFAPLLSATEHQLVSSDHQAVQRRYTDADIAVLRQVKVLLATKLSYAEVCLRLKVVHFSDVPPTSLDALSGSLHALSELSLDANALVIETPPPEPSASHPTHSAIPTLFNQLPPELQDELDQLRPDQPKALPAPYIAAKENGSEIETHFHPTAEHDEHIQSPASTAPAAEPAVVDAPAASDEQPQATHPTSDSAEPLPTHDQQAGPDTPRKPSIFTGTITSKTVFVEGPLSTIYKVTDERGAVYAVEEIPDRFTNPQERAQAHERCKVVLAALQRLAHPRIPRVYGWARKHDHVAVVMDVVNGQSLATITQQQGAISEWQVLEWANQICEALDYLHTNKIIHGDMTPSNIIAGDHHDGVKLLSLGIAPLLQPSATRAQEQRLPYAAPEQRQGIVTRASDIYALGATLYHLLTGEVPSLTTSAPLPAARDLQPGISARTSEIIQRALHPNARERFPSVETLRAALLLTQARVHPSIEPAPLPTDELSASATDANEQATPQTEQVPQEAQRTHPNIQPAAPAQRQETEQRLTEQPALQEAQKAQPVALADTPPQSGEAHDKRPGAQETQPTAAAPTVTNTPDGHESRPISTTPKAPTQSKVQNIPPGVERDDIPTPAPDVQQTQSVTTAAESPAPTAAPPAESLPTPQPQRPQWEQPELESLVARSYAASAAQIAQRHNPIARQFGGAARFFWLGIAALIVAVAALFAVMGPGRSLQPTPTPQTFIAQSFTLESVEVIVAPGTDDLELRNVFVFAFTQAARTQYGESVRVDETTLAYIGGLPQKIREDSQGARYRGTMTGTILAPKE